MREIRLPFCVPPGKSVTLEVALWADRSPGKPPVPLGLCVSPLSSLLLPSGGSTVLPQAGVTLLSPEGSGGEGAGQLWYELKVIRAVRVEVEGMPGAR